MNKKYKAIIYIILSALSFSFMNMFVRMAGDIPAFEKSFFRNAVALVFATVILIKNKQSFKWKKGNFKYLFLRSLTGLIGLVCNFYALGKIPLANASILNKMSPFFVIIFSIIILKEKLTLLQGTAVFVAFIGTLFVIKPSFENIDLMPSLIALLGGMGAGFAYTMVRILGNRGENGSLIVFFFSAFSCIVTFPSFFIGFQPLEWWQVLLLIGAGLGATGGQFGITAAYCYAPAREISIYDYSQIIFVTLLGFIFLGEVPDIYSFIGYFLICAMAFLMFLYNNNKWIFKKKTN